jgi:putative flippase GtrA
LEVRKSEFWQLLDASVIMTTAFLKIAEAWKQRTLLAKLFSFASVGMLNAAVDLSVFAVAFQIIHLPLVASNVLAWAVAVTFSYAMNTKITFGRETGGALSLGQYLRFAASGIFGVTVATTVLILASHHTIVPLAKLASIAAGFVVNFSMSHFVVFRGRHAAPRASSNAS